MYNNQYPPAGGQQPPQPVPSQYFLQGAPHRPPFVPNVPARPHVQPHLPLITGTLILSIIQPMSSTDPMWQALFWRANQNQYQNPVFIEMVATVCDLLDYKMGTQGHMNIQQTIMDCCQHIGFVFAAKELQMNPGLQQWLPPETIQNANSILQWYLATGVQINQYMMATPQLTNPQTQMAMAPANYGGRGPANNIYNPVQTPTYGQQMNPMYQQPAQPPQQVYNQQPAPRPQAPMRSVENDPVMRRYAQNDQPVIKEQVEPAPQPKAKILTEFHMEGDNSTSPVTQRVPTQGSGIKLTPSSRGNYHTLYDPQTEESFIDVVDKMAVEVILPRTEELTVDYKRHETIHFFRVPSREEFNSADKEEARKAFQAIVSQQNIEVRLKEHDKDTAELTGEDENPITIDKPFFIESELYSVGDYDPFLALTRWLNENNIASTTYEDVPVTFTLVTISPFSFADEDAIRVAELMTSRTWEVLRDRLIVAAEHMSPRLYTKLNEDLTEAVNTCLRVRLGIRISIDSFIEDVLTVTPYLTAKFSEVFVDKWEQMAYEVAKSVCMVVNNKADIFVQQFGETKPNEDGSIPLRCAFARAQVFTMLPIMSNNLIAKYEGDAGRVRATGPYADLHNAIENIFDTTVSELPIYRRKLVTLDGKVIELFRGAFGGSYLVRKGKE